MKDGFDSNVAKKMPRRQKRPNRPWNVDPVQIDGQKAETAAPEVSKPQKTVAKTVETPIEIKPAEAKIETPSVPVIEAKTKVEAKLEVEAKVQPKTDARKVVEAMSPPVRKVEERPKAELPDTAKAVKTIEEISSEFSHLIFEKHDVQGRLKKQEQDLRQAQMENSILRENIAEMQSSAVASQKVNDEITFLNEQLQDAEFYIQNLTGMLSEKNELLSVERQNQQTLEQKFSRINGEVHNKAKLDVKVTILERDLTMANSRISELENELESEYRRREPLEQEVIDLKGALDKVYSSLNHIKLKAKREAYGS